MPRTNADDPLRITDPEPSAAAPGRGVTADVAATSSVVAGRHPVLTRAAAAVLALAVGTTTSSLKYLDAEQPIGIARAGSPPAAAQSAKAEATTPVELTLVAAKPHVDPFLNVVLDVVFTDPAGGEKKVPAFWSGKDQWKVRYASPVVGVHRWRSTCSAADDSGLHGIEGKVEITPYTGTNPLYRHGPLRVAKDHRHFEHSDGTAFLWLGDTWWKNLCERMSWEGFQELAADRKAKGFNVVQIVCGPYPDEGLMEASWENEGGKPYLNREFTRINPSYFEYADRRIKHLVDTGLVPAIVGGWGRADCDGLKMAGVEGIKRHWRNLIARYGAYPTVWIIGGESGGPKWTEVARYVQQTDPFHHPSTMHPAESGRTAVTDETVLDFDMLQTGHGDWEAARGAIPKLKAAYDRKPPMAALIGECCYEGHMQTAFADQQRYVFWGSMLSGAAGHTYGAAGVWHASVEGDPGVSYYGHVFDWTTWKEGMSYPGSTQLGLGKKLLEKYPWWRFEPHPEWVSPGLFAAGIPGKVIFVYIPKRGIYKWDGITVKNLRPGVRYAAFFYDPASGRCFDQGIVTTTGSWDSPGVPSPQDWVLVMQALNLGDPVNHKDVAANEAVSGQLKPPGAAFARVTGPGWLTIKPDGSFTGKPAEFDSGVNSWVVSVTKGDGAPTFIELQIKVIGTSIFAENFNSYSGTQNAVQWQSGQKVAHSGTVAGWTKAGEHSVHAVDRANRAGRSNPQNWAVMIFQDNVITSGAFAANTSGQVYRIDFEASPAVYAASNSEQATQAGDELLIEILRGDDRVLASHRHSPGAWTGTLAFAAGSFQYTGDGSGDVRLRIKPAGPQTSGRFHGAIDNIIVRKAAVR
jgi:hypothetical protein